jgi:hypothetical protein
MIFMLLRSSLPWYSSTLTCYSYSSNTHIYVDCVWAGGSPVLRLFLVGCYVVRNGIQSITGLTHFFTVLFDITTLPIQRCVWLEWCIWKCMVSAKAPGLAPHVDPFFYL